VEIRSRLHHHHFGPKLRPCLCLQRILLIVIAYTNLLGTKGYVVVVVVVVVVVLLIVILIALDTLKVWND